MRIVSQCKNLSVNFDRIIIMRDGLSIIAMNESCNKKLLLGIYQTEERAKEVLEQIYENYLELLQRIYYMPEE